MSSEHPQSESTPREWMLRLCAEHGSRLGYGDQGERLCPEGCVNPRAEYVVVVPLKDVLVLLRESDSGDHEDSVKLIEKVYRLA